MFKKRLDGENVELKLVTQAFDSGKKRAEEVGGNEE
jgi:hypothetical protein